MWLTNGRDVADIWKRCNWNVADICNDNRCTVPDTLQGLDIPHVLNVLYVLDVLIVIDELNVPDAHDVLDVIDVLFYLIYLTYLMYLI